MPQLDLLLVYNEMIHLVVGFFLLYVLLYRGILVKIAYNLKFRHKFVNIQNISDIKGSFNTFWNTMVLKSKKLELKSFYYSFFRKKAINCIKNMNNNINN